VKERKREWRGEKEEREKGGQNMIGSVIIPVLYVREERKREKERKREREKREFENAQQRPGRLSKEPKLNERKIGNKLRALFQKKTNDRGPRPNDTKKGTNTNTNPKDIVTNKATKLTIF